MKRIVVLLLSLFFALSVSAKVETQVQGTNKIFNFTVDGFKIDNVTVEGKDFSKITLTGLDGFTGIYYRVGYPEIPVIRFFVLTNDPNSIKIDMGTSDYISMAFPISIYPNQESLVKVLGATRPFLFNQSIYVNDDFFPGKEYLIEDAGSIKGVPQKLITLFPIQYNPTTGEFKQFKTMRVSYKEPNIFASPSPDTFVFIVGKKYDSNKSLADYIKFKKTLGYNTIKLLVGTDVSADAENIRAKLKGIWNQYKQSFKYVLIVGDVEDVPSKIASNISGVTDHYFRAIDTDDYSSDINGPDVGVGRITVKNDVELKNVIDKFFKYQKGNFETSSWLKNISFIATDDRYEIAEGSHNYVINRYATPLGYSGTFPLDPQIGGDKLYAITHQAEGSDVVSRAKEGRGIINYSGHGSNYSWAGPNVSQSDVRSLDHADALPFVISNACVTGDFTKSESFGETWIKHPKGAIMFWGSMDSSYWDEDDILEKSMYDGIFSLGNETFQQITDYALGQVWKFYGGAGKSKYYWETYVTFGDPSIALRLNPPSKLKVLTNTILEQNSINSLSVVDSFGNPANNVQITIGDMGGDFVKTYISDKKGKVNLDLSDFPSDILVLTAYSQDYKIFKKTFRVSK